MDYRQTAKNIKNLKIQGAENIAVKAVEAFGLELRKTQDLKHLKKVFTELKKARATEPALRNALMYCLLNYKKNPDIASYVIKYFKNSKQKIAELGAKKIHNGMVIFTHCHSSTVEAILIKAKNQKKKFIVYNTETRPKFQGRITAENLAKAGIAVYHFVESAAHTYLKKADLFLFGCDSLSSEGRIINKVGTQFLAEYCYTQKIPAYSVTNSWKFNAETIQGEDEIIEQRNPKEVWENPPKGVTILNPAFEIVSPDILTGIITEIGIFKPETLVSEIQKVYPWMV